MTRENPPTAILTPEEGQCLLRLARATIAEQLKCPIDRDDLRSIQTALQAPVFNTRCGVFVTLSLEGALRGCIGSLSASEPLAENVRRNAINAAFHDPRFAPLTAPFAWLPERRTALIEMALASGLALLAEDARDCTRTTTLGTGQLMAAALDLLAGAGGWRALDLHGRQLVRYLARGLYGHVS